MATLHTVGIDHAVEVEYDAHDEDDFNDGAYHGDLADMSIVLWLEDEHFALGS